MAENGRQEPSLIPAEDRELLDQVRKKAEAEGLTSRRALADKLGVSPGTAEKILKSQYPKRKINNDSRKRYRDWLATDVSGTATLAPSLTLVERKAQQWDVVVAIVKDFEKRSSTSEGEAKPPTPGKKPENPSPRKKGKGFA